MGKFKRLPNNFGTITRMSGKRRNPFRARVVVEKIVDVNSGKLKKVYQAVGYYATYQDAIIALTEYHKNPYDLENGKVTFAEVFNNWSDEAYPTMGKSNINAYNAAFKTCKELHERRFVDIKYQDLQHVVDTCGKNYPTLRKINLLFHMLYKYTEKNGVIMSDQSKFVNIAQYKDKNPNKIDRNPFKQEDIDLLWEWSDKNEYVKMILMMIYTGVRQGEIRDLMKEDVHLEEQYFFIKKSKTPSGVRNVPICDKILPFFEYWMNHVSETGLLLTTPTGHKFQDRNFRDSYYTEVLNQVNVSEPHLPHDTRHTFISKMTSAGIDDRIIRKIVGHAGKGITENVYTHLEMETLLEAVNKI